MGSKHDRANTLHQKALQMLETSTMMLEVASELLSQGNHIEAERLWDEARSLRKNSLRLLAESKAPLDQHFVSHYADPPQSDFRKR